MWDIDGDTLPGLLSAAHVLPDSVTGVTWDLREAHFIDVAGLHLLVHQRSACQEAGRLLTVVGLGRQPRRLLELAWEVFPEGWWADFLPGGLLAAAA
ncbi:STAS domain-containing protein [Streptomyces fagopyri]